MPQGPETPGPATPNGGAKRVPPTVHLERGVPALTRGPVSDGVSSQDRTRDHVGRATLDETPLHPRLGR